MVNHSSVADLQMLKNNRHQTKHCLRVLQEMLMHVPARGPISNSILTPFRSKDATFSHVGVSTDRKRSGNITAVNVHEV